MPLGYNPNDIPETGKGGEVPPGTYDFLVDAAEEMTFRSGNRGVKAVLTAEIPDGRDIKVFDNLMYMPNALWKMKQFLVALGFNPKQPPDAVQLLGKRGRAEFEKGDNGFLGVASYLPASASTAAAPSSGLPLPDPNPEPWAPGPDDDVPF